MTDGRRSRPDFGELREAASGLRPWGLIRCVSNPALGLSCAERMVIVALARHVDAYGYCWPSLRRLAGCAGLGERRTWQAIKTLEGRGLIAVESLNGRVNTYRIAAAAVEEFAGAEPKPETVAQRARVAEAENIGGAAPKPATVAQRAEVATVAQRAEVAPERATVACGATTLADSAGTVAPHATTIAAGANELAARTSFTEEGCPGGHRAPAEGDEESREEAERHLEAARRSLPERFAPAFEGVKAAYRRGGDPRLLRQCLASLAAEAGTPLAEGAP